MSRKTRPTPEEHDDIGTLVETIRIATMQLSSRLQEHYGKTSKQAVKASHAIHDLDSVKHHLSEAAHKENYEGTQESADRIFRWYYGKSKTVDRYRGGEWISPTE